VVEESDMCCLYSRLAIGLREVLPNSLLSDRLFGDCGGDCGLTKTSFGSRFNALQRRSKFTRLEKTLYI